MSPETKRGIKKLALLKNINLYKLVIFLWQYVLCNDYFFESFNFRSNESILGIIISLNGSVSIPCAPPCMSKNNYAIFIKYIITWVAMPSENQFTA